MSCETLAKKAARYRVWHRVREDLGEDRFKRSRFLYLAGPDGGDASVLAGFGVPPRCQLAVDMDAMALASFHEKHPDVPTFHGSVADVQGHFDVIFLDFYCNVEQPRLPEWLAQGYRCLARRDDAYFIFAVSYGREAAYMPTIIGTASRIKHWMKEDSRAYLRAHRTAEAIANAYEPTAEDIAWEQAGIDDRVYKALGRLDVAIASIRACTLERRLVAGVEFVYAYYGTYPMLIAGWRAKAFPKKWSAEKFEKKTSEWQRVRAGDDLDRDSYERLKGGDPYELLALVESDGFYNEAHLLLNMPRKNIAALRAVRTRRTSPVDAQPTSPKTGGEGPKHGQQAS